MGAQGFFNGGELLKIENDVQQVGTDLPKGFVHPRVVEQPGAEREEA